MITIIIPVLNEAKILKERSEFYTKLSKCVEIIFVDGQSGDDTCQLAAQYGKVIRSQPGRGQQKNIGAQAANSEYFLFLHVDAMIDLDAFWELDAWMKARVDCGCFPLRVDDRRWIFRVYEWVVNIRARYFKVFDGDLGLFIRKEIFDQAGTFPQMALMEDIEFSKTLKRLSEIRIHPKAITVSSRKWDEQGFLRTLWNYSLCYIQFWTGLKCYRKTFVEYTN